MTKTKTDRLVKVLSKGKQVSAEQIYARTGLVNPSSTIHRLREQGLVIYTNKRNTDQGVKYFYRAPQGQF